MKPTISLFVVALLLATPRIATAQSSAFRPAPSSLFRPAVAPIAVTDTLNLPKTYWKEGALIVGIPMAMLGGYAGYGLCQDSESSDPPNCALSAVGVAIISGVVGAVTGALIGGLFEKSPQ